MTSGGETRRPVAVVTGGRRGIGSATATALGAAGFDVVVLDIVDDEGAASTLAAIRGGGAAAKLVIGDIADLDGREGLVEKLFAAFGTVDCLVNNAGVLSNVRGADLLSCAPENFDRVMGVNLRGTFFLTQTVARRMVEEGEQPRPIRRSIVTITSAAVGKARTDSPEYAFSKTCLSLMSQMFALRLGRHGISTYEIRPGVTKTEMSRDAWPMYDTLIEEGRFPIPRMGMPEDVAQTVVSLATGRMPYSTGDRVYVDGGFNIPTSQLPKRKT